MRETSDQPRRAQPLELRASSDAQIFFAAVLGIATVLLTHWLLVSLVSLGANQDEVTATLVSRLGPPATILPFSVLLIFVPAALAFLAIGLPFALRTLVALVRGSLERGQALGLLGLAACVAAAVIEIKAGGSGVVSLAVAGLIGAFESPGVLGPTARSVGWRLLGAAGLALLGLSYYEYVYLSSARLSVAVAPTLLLFGFFFLGAALVLTTAAQGPRRGETRRPILLAWVVAALWYAAPSLRLAAASAQAADRLELCATLATGATLLVLGARNGRAGGAYKPPRP